MVRPQNITVQEAISSLSARYEQYVTVNTSRNLLLFKGPRSVLKHLRSDLRLIDTAAPHILVDFLAVELTDEANRNLGLDLAYTNDHFGFFSLWATLSANFLMSARQRTYELDFRAVRWIV